MRGVVVDLQVDGGATEAFFYTVEGGIQILCFLSDGESLRVGRFVSSEEKLVDIAKLQSLY